ncbi:MAG: arylesterase [Burkholderiales bacterium]|nr:arylesterase [Burkholderiales bacterium]
MVVSRWSRRDFIVAGLAACYAGHAAAAAPVIVVVGDSMSAEYGIRRGTGWVALLQQRLDREKLAARVVNASISGDTTSGGRSRLAGVLKQHKPTHVVLELGGNDALRGLSLSMTEDNLSAMVKTAQAAGARVLLVGMQVPPNYGADYANRFSGLFAKVAREHRAGLVPFLLKGLADDGAEPTKYFLPDRIHLKEEAQPRILDNVWPELKKLLK